MKKYAFAGASGRAYWMFAQPLVQDFADVAEVCGIFDPNRLRSEYIARSCGISPPIYTNFDAMLRETHPDVVVVTTMDSTHHQYIIAALQQGCEVICEKPITTDEEKCRQILAAEKASGKRVTVTFNYRFNPYVTRIKQLLRQGAVGQPLTIDFEYLLDRVHGADYYRRWHRKRENSGGLLVHKSTHHFDFISWWIDAQPEKVYANGFLRFYGANGSFRGQRCKGCAHAAACPFVFKNNDVDWVREMYYQAEGEDGYYRDRCVFDEEIDIEDTMSVAVRYTNKTLLTYSLTTYEPYEGWKVSITGTEGRLEAAEYHSGLRAGCPNDSIAVYNAQGEKIEYTVPKAAGTHGGGDVRIREMLFRGVQADPLGHFAGSGDGVRAAMIGICAEKSIQTGKAYTVQGLLEGRE